jgi:hypothetical protein
MRNYITRYKTDNLVIDIEDRDVDYLVVTMSSLEVGKIITYSKNFP